MLGQVAREAAERFGDHIAYVAPDGRTLSYAELDRHADETAVGLAKRGVGEGDVVALVLPQQPEYVVLYIAAARIGAITAGVNTRLSRVEREVVLQNASPKLVIDVPAAIDDLRVTGAHPKELGDDPDRPVAIVFTSGTTGAPKGAVFSNRQLSFITKVDTGGNWGGGGATFAATSFAHLGPMTKLPGSLMRGGTTHVLSRWKASDALRMITDHRMTSIGGIPTQFALMLQEPEFESYDLASVRAIVMGGGPATPTLVREARERFGAPVAIRYSCTEAGIGIGTAFDAPHEDAEVSVGRPHAGVDLDLRNVTDGVGEVCLRSAAVMDGYWHAPELTADALTDDGFVRTGDLGWIDEAGRLRLAGRAKEMYVRGGYNVYPMEVEAVLATHPAIADVAVAPRPDDVMGEIGVAVVVLRDGSEPPSPAELRSFASDHLAAYKVPEAVVVTEALPLTAMEKLDRRALAALVRHGDG
ncbi:MAG TPA: class I adenylate-forming enzyme family protein [Acidimicrobiales bacterium]|jgi:acyl-CoA synthetase (AMP-forming)/AMP-acid ligase II|nr:class I adenylate-forming enzyme family protein [Acidimicrobiales bacterium]